MDWLGLEGSIESIVLKIPVGSAVQSYLRCEPHVKPLSRFLTLFSGDRLVTGWIPTFVEQSRGFIVCQFHTCISQPVQNVFHFLSMVFRRLVRLMFSATKAVFFW
jgi:hypothetical protein